MGYRCTGAALTHAMTPRFHWIFTLMLWVGLSSLALSVSAKPRAATKFDEGLALFKQGAHEEAARTFYEAHRIAPHADAMYNAGLSWELAKQRGPAATAYETALQLDLGDKAASDARKRLIRLAALLGRVEVAAPEGSTIRAAPFVVRDGSAVFYFEPGRHRIDVTLPDGDYAVRRVSVVAGDTTVVLVESGGADANPPEGEDEEEAQEPSAPDVSPSAENSYRTLGWASLGVAGALSGAAVVLGMSALSAKDEFEASGNRDGDARERAERLRLWTNLAWGGAAAFAVTGGAVLILAKDDKGTTSVALRGRF